LIGYCRVSSQAQCDSGASIDAQIEKIKLQAALLGHPLIDIITDAGESAKDLDRPGAQRVLGMVKARQVDAVIVKRMDRITRNVVDGGNLISMFEKHGVRLISIDEGFDMGTIMGRAMIGIITVFAAMERELIGERTRIALQQIKQSGCPAGPAPYGYRSQERPVIDGKKTRMPLLEDEAEQHTIRVILDMHSRGDSYRDMAAELNRAGYRTRKNGKWTFPAMGQIIKANSVVVAGTQEAA